MNTRALYMLLLVSLVACGVGISQQTQVQAVPLDSPFAGSAGSGHRSCLQGDATYYVADGGSDSADGKSAATAWKTPQHAYEFVRDNLDLCGRFVTLQLASSLSDQANILQGRLVGSVGARSFIVSGNPANPAAFSISASTGNALFRAEDGAELTVQGVTMTSATGAGLVVSAGTIRFGNVVFGNMAAAHLDAAGGQSLIQAVAPYTVAGSTNHHAVAEDHALIALPTQVTITGGSWISFVQGDLGGMIDGTAFSYVGNGSGDRAGAFQNGIVFTGGANGNPAFFPGTGVVGVGSGGVYQ